MAQGIPIADINLQKQRLELEQMKHDGYILIKFFNQGSAMFSTHTENVYPTQILAVAEHLGILGRKAVLEDMEGRVQDTEAEAANDGQT